jgi:hypothetical protein
VICRPARLAFISVPPSSALPPNDLYFFGDAKQRDDRGTELTLGKITERRIA